MMTPAETPTTANIEALSSKLRSVNGETAPWANPLVLQWCHAAADALDAWPRSSAEFGRLVDDLETATWNSTIDEGDDPHRTPARAALMAHNAAQQAEIERSRLKAETFERQYRQVCQDHAEVVAELKEARLRPQEAVVPDVEILAAALWEANQINDYGSVKCSWSEWLAYAETHSPLHSQIVKHRTTAETVRTILASDTSPLSTGSNPASPLREIDHNSSEGASEASAIGPKARQTQPVQVDTANTAATHESVTGGRDPSQVSLDALREAAVVVAEAARNLITKGLRNNGEDLIVVEYRDNSDPHYALCNAVKAYEAALNPTGDA